MFEFTEKYQIKKSWSIVSYFYLCKIIEYSLIHTKKLINDCVNKKLQD